MATPAAATPAPAGAGTAVSTGTGKPAADSSKPAAEAKDEEEDEVVAEEADPRDDDINEQAAKLHAYLSRLETPQLKEDYQDKLRPWRFQISKISLINESDSRVSIFLCFALTDNRPLTGVAARLQGLLGGSPQEARTLTQYTPTVRNILPQQQVFFPVNLSFHEWGSRASINMTYHDILRRGLRVEVWERHEYGANVLLGSTYVTLSSLIHGGGSRDLPVTRNVAPTTRGRSMNCGTVSFYALLEEAKLQHQLHFREWGLALSNHVGHPEFQHPCSLRCTWPCFCTGIAACCAGAEDTLHQWGFGEMVEARASISDGSVTENSSIKRKKYVAFSAPLHSGGMAAAAATADNAAVAKWLEATSADRKLGAGEEPMNDSASFSKLTQNNDAEALTINCSRSLLESKEMSVEFRILCRRCCSEGVGRATIPLTSVTAASFLPFTVPVVFSRLSDGCCGVWVTAGILRGFIIWSIEGAPLMHHFTQPGGGGGSSDSRGESTAANALSLTKPDPCLGITVHRVGVLPLVHRDQTVDPRVTIYWGGSTQTTSTLLNRANPQFEETLRFPFPRLPGRNTSGTQVDAADLLLPLESNRHALIRVWDDASYPTAAPPTMAGYVRRTELIAEALVELPFERMLGLDIVDTTGGGVSAASSGWCSVACNAISKEVRVLLSNILDTPDLPAVPLEAKLVVPGASESLDKPTIVLTLQLQHLPLQSRASCMPSVPPPDELNLLPDFSNKVHADAATVLVRGTTTYHVSAPGDVTHIGDEVGGQPLPRAYRAARRKHDNGGGVGGREGGGEGGVNNPLVGAGVGALTNSVHPSSTDPIADLSHLTWLSLLIRMADISNDKASMPWWLYITPNGQQFISAVGDDEDEGGGNKPLPKDWNTKTPCELLTQYISPLLYATDECGVRRCISSLLSPIPAEHILRFMKQGLEELRGSAFADLDSTMLLLPQDDSTATDYTAGGGTTTESGGREDYGSRDMRWHLAARAAALVASIEFSDSAEEVRQIRRERGILVNEANQSSTGSGGDAHCLDAAHSGTGRLGELDEVDEERGIVDPTRFFAGIVRRSLLNSDWLSPSAFLSMRRGGVAEHAALLCSMLLGLGHDAYLAVGIITSPDTRAVQEVDSTYSAKVASLVLPEDRANAAGTEDGVSAVQTEPTDAASVAKSAALSAAQGAVTTGNQFSFANKPDNLTVRTKPSPYAPPLEAPSSLGLAPVGSPAPQSFARPVQGGGSAAAPAAPPTSGSRLGIGPQSLPPRSPALKVAPVGAASPPLIAPRLATQGAGVDLPGTRRRADQPPLLARTDPEFGSHIDVVVDDDDDDDEGSDDKGSDDEEDPPGHVTPEPVLRPTGVAGAAPKQQGTPTTSSAAGVAGHRARIASPVATRDDAVDDDNAHSPSLLSPFSAADGTTPHLEQAPQTETQRQNKINLLLAQMDTVKRLVAESLHYFVVVFSPMRAPGRADLGEPEQVRVFDVDGSITVAKLKDSDSIGVSVPGMDGLKVIQSSTGVEYRRILLLANNNNIWVNNQPASDVPKTIFEGNAIEAHTKGANHRALSRPSSISQTQFNLSQPNMWLTLFPETASAVNAGGAARSTGPSTDAGVQSQASKLINSSPVFMHVGPGLGNRPLSYEGDTGGQKYFPGTGLDGTVCAPPAPITALVKRDLTDMELGRLTSEINSELNEAIANKRTYRRLPASVVSEKPSYRFVVEQLRQVLIAHASLDLYAPDTADYGEARGAFLERIKAVKMLVPGSLDGTDTATYMLVDGSSTSGGGGTGTPDTGTVGTRGQVTELRAGDMPGRSFDTGTVISGGGGAQSGRGGGVAASAAARSMQLDSRLNIVKINGASPARIKRVALASDSLWMQPQVEIAVAVIVQQLMSGVLVTRVAIMTVFPL